MCGIAGLIHLKTSHLGESLTPPLINKCITTFKTMIQEMAAFGYGKDATGYIIGNRGVGAVSLPKITTYKDGISGSTFFQKRGGQILEQQFCNHTTFVIGHVRMGTHGSPSNNYNNHPFISKNIIGVHNGIISNHRDIFKDHDDLTAKGDCDSEAIFELLNKYAADTREQSDAIRYTSQALEGWYSCVAIDSTNFSNVLFFRRGGPMTIKYIESIGLLVFASSEAIIDKALKISGVADNSFVSDITYNDDEIFSVDAITDHSMQTSRRYSLTRGTKLMGAVTSGRKRFIPAPIDESSILFTN